jgi:hypothetical protein
VPCVQESTVETEVRAAHNVLEACAQTDVMKRVVFTSSVTAVVWSGAGAHREEVADERSWSDLAFCRKFKVRTSERLAVVFKFRFFMDWPPFPVPCVGNFHQTTVVTNPHDLHPTIKSKPMG